MSIQPEMCSFFFCSLHWYHSGNIRQILLAYPILILCLDWKSCSPSQKALGWHPPVQYTWHVGLNCEGLVLESKSFLHWSQWECHHWLHGSNLPLRILDNLWVVWNSEEKADPCFSSLDLDWVMRRETAL